jgi:hypothetical protein
MGAPYPRVKHCLDFFFVFSNPLPAWRNLFPASGIFCGGRYQPGSTGMFWPAEGDSQPLTTSKMWKNQGSTLRRKWTCVQALMWHPTYSLGLPVRAQISNHRRACTQPLLLYIISCSMPGWNDFEYLNCWQCSLICTVKPRVQDLVAHTQTPICYKNWKKN